MSALEQGKTWIADALEEVRAALRAIPTEEADALDELAEQLHLAGVSAEQALRVAFQVVSLKPDDEQMAAIMGLAARLQSMMVG